MAWGKNGSTNLSSAGDNITLSNLTASKTNMFLCHGFASGSNPVMAIQYNSDTGSNYARRGSTNGSVDGTATSGTYAHLSGGGLDTGAGFVVGYILNVPSKEKLSMNFFSNGATIGAGTAPDRGEYTGKWANTSDSITTINITNANTGDFGTNSNLSVLGSELTPASAKTIETNSIFIETDTANRYWFNGSSWINPYGDYYYTFDTDPTGSSPQTYFYVDTANSWWYGYSGTNLTSNQGQYIDLGSNLSTDWTMAFKVLTNQDGNTNALNAIVGLILGSTTGTDYNNSAHDYVNLWFNTDSSSRRDIRVSYGINAVSNSAAAAAYLVDGTGAYGGTTLPDATNTTLYVLVKKSGTTVTAELYTDSALQNQYGVTGTLTSVSVSGLRYLKLMGRTASGTDNQVIVKIQSVQIKDGDANWTPSWIEG